MIIDITDCFMCENGQTLDLEIDRECMQHLSMVAELICQFHYGVRKRSLNGKSYLFFCTTYKTMSVFFLFHF